MSIFFKILNSKLIKLISNLFFESMEACAGFKCAISNLLNYNLEPNALLFSHSDGKFQALNLDSNYLVYLAD